MGGLCLYFLQKIRGQKTTVETAFCGFSYRFLHLFLAGFATSLLTWLGFICLVLPGIYLLIAWIFTLPLVVDKQIDFWSAMELSRKVVTKHWFKLLGFGIVLLLLTFAGVLALVVGVFVAAPLVLATLMYAYDDIFGAITPAAAPAPVGTGPSGTVVLPMAPPILPRPGVGGWSPEARAGLAALVLLIGVVGVILLPHRNRPFDFPFRHHEEMQSEPQAQAVSTEAAESIPQTESVGQADKTSPPVFGPVIERVLQARETGTNQFLDLDTEKLLTPSPELVGALAAGPAGEQENRFWQALDISTNAPRFDYIKWLRDSGADLMFTGNGKIIGFDGLFRVAHGDTPANWDDWDVLTPEQARAAVEQDDAAPPATQVQPSPAPASGASSRPAMQLDSSEPGGPIVNLLTRDQSVNWFFKTREGRAGVLQIVRFTDNPPAAVIRYKLIQQGASNETSAEPALSAQARKAVREELNDRLEAASSMNQVAEKDAPLAGVAADAAKARQVDIVKKSLGQMLDPTRRDVATHEAARLLAQRGLRKQAIEIAKGITDYTMRDQVLSELAK
jgi:hypothetical protein